MESPSNLRSLSQALALKKAQDTAEVAASTSQELKKLVEDLQRQSSAVLTTTAIAITQSASKEMQHAEQQLKPQINQVRQDLSQQLGKMHDSIIPAIDLMQSEMNKRLAQMQAQIDLRTQQMQDQTEQQLKPLDETEMQTRMDKIQRQINKQIKPLLEALGTIKSDSQALAMMTAKSWLKPVLISVVSLLSISVPAWALIHYLASQVQSNLELIQQQRQTLQQLQTQTWGVTMHQDSSGQFLILPEGTSADPGWQFGKRQGVKLLKK